MKQIYKEQFPWTLLLLLVFFVVFFGLVSVCMLQIIWKARLQVDTEAPRRLGSPGLFTTGNSSVSLFHFLAVHGER